MAIKFGTDGWRAVISRDFTFENVAIVAQAIADYVLSQNKYHQGLIIGYDSRFLSREYAEECAKVICGNGIKVYLTNKITPTPVVSYAVKHLNTAGGIMVTASHNPPKYNGVKFKAAYGGSALPDIIADIEKYLFRNRVKMDELDSAKAQGLLEYFDADQMYFGHIKSLVNFELIKSLDSRIIVDPMHGAGSGYVKRLLQEVGVECIEIRGEHNPGFGGINPEPIDKNLGALIDAVKSHNAHVGLATDGDADRIGAIDATGDFISSHQIYALLLRHLIENRGWSGGVVKTFSTTQMIDKLVNKYGIKAFETPIGFKYICELFLCEDILIGGEESGGIGIKNHIPERDGILISLLLLEIMATYQQTLGEIIKDLMDEIGFYYYDRIDLHISMDKIEKLMNELKSNSIDSIANTRVAKVQTLDGVKFIMNDDSWLLFRASGTEPVVRVYCEADCPEKVQQYLEFGRDILKGI